MRTTTKQNPLKTKREAAAEPPRPPKPVICPHCGNDIHAAPKLPLAAPPVLSERQVQVLKCVARGMNRTEIAQELGISPRTAEFYRMLVMKSLRLDSIAALTLYASQHGLV